MSQDAQQCMLAHQWDDSIDPTGWWMSEKLDGVRAYWTGSKFYSRQGNEFFAPAFFTKDLPKEPLDGELWCGRGLFSQTISIVKKQKNRIEDDWKFVTYLIFDAPKHSGDYEKRVRWLNDTINPSKATTYATVVGVQKCQGRPHLQEVLKKVLLRQGEGIMLRKAHSHYEHGRSHSLLKVKYFHDEEALVTGKENGNGRCQNMMGKLHCKLPNGVQFKVGTGFNDMMRKNPPKNGTVITLKYQELSDKGNPRFPVFVRICPDKSWSDVLKAAQSKPPFSQIRLKKNALTIQKTHSILFSIVPSRNDRGDKQVTQGDVDDESNDLDDAGNNDSSNDNGNNSNSPSKPPCRYGSACYQTNDQHKQSYSHPTKPQASPTKTGEKRSNSASSSSSTNNNNIITVNSKDKAPCIFGTECYRRNDEHISRYSHDFHALQNISVSQVDLEDYYKLKGDEEEEVIQNEIENEFPEESENNNNNNNDDNNGQEWFLADEDNKDEISAAAAAVVPINDDENSATLVIAENYRSSKVRMNKEEYEFLKRAAEVEAASKTIEVDTEEYEKLMELKARMTKRKAGQAPLDAKKQK
jgi:hypothetical protein